MVINARPQKAGELIGILRRPRLEVIDNLIFTLAIRYRQPLVKQNIGRKIGNEIVFGRKPNRGHHLTPLGF